jgi:hypothetical protein
MRDRLMRAPTTTFLLYLVCGVCAAQAVLSSVLLARAAAVAGLVSGTVALAARHTHAMLGDLLRSIGRIPASAEVHRDEDGAAVYITRTDGELVIVRVPEHVAEDGPEAAIQWAVRETLDG